MEKIVMEQVGLKILLVDDEEEFVNFLAEELRSEYGYQASVAKTGTEAIEFLKNNHRGLDVILLDYLMPGMNGLEVLRWIRENNYEIPVIMLTGAGSEPIAVEAMKLGAYDYIRKEQLDFQRLDFTIRATHERHLYRIAEAMEEERLKEIALNSKATDRMRDVLSAITPSLNSALGQIAAEIEMSAQKLLKQVPESARLDAVKMLDEIERQVKILEAGIRGLLSLYQLVYAHHVERESIEHLGKEFEENVIQPLKLTGSK